MKKLFYYALLVAIVVALVGIVRPYWNKYWIQKEVEAAAVYGTKNSLDHTRRFLLDNLKQEGYRIAEDQVYIDKDPKNNVTVTVRYSDKISIFGKEVQKLRFTVTSTQREIKAYF